MNIWGEDKIDAEVSLRVRSAVHRDPEYRPRVLNYLETEGISTADTNRNPVWRFRGSRTSHSPFTTGRKKKLVALKLPRLEIQQSLSFLPLVYMLGLGVYQYSEEPSLPYTWEGQNLSLITAETTWRHRKNSLLDNNGPTASYISFAELFCAGEGTYTRIISSISFLALS